MRFLNREWPVLRSYAGDSLRCIAMPLGGIGTGTVSLGGRGNLRDWEIRNRPAKGEAPGDAGVRDYGAAALFVLYCRKGAGEPVLRALEGSLLPPYEGAFGSTAGFAGVPRFRGCSFHAAYPLAQVCLWDRSVPLRVRLEALNPLVPGDADASGVPAAILRYVLSNPTREPVQATVCGSLANLAGPGLRSNAVRREGGLTGLFLTSAGEDPLAREAGTMALVTTAADTSVITRWPDESWRRPLLHFWDDLRADGRLDDRPQAGPAPSAWGSLAASVLLEPGRSAAVTFVLSWHFPNRYSWAPAARDDGSGRARLAPEDRIGNYYTEHYRDAWDAAERTVRALPDLEARTLRFVRAFCGCGLPPAVKEAALFNLSTLRSETCFRTPDGNLFGWEGCSDAAGCCSGSCTHVWNYETATAFLFGDLARRMREVEFLHATHPDTGCMSFRVQLPLDREQGQGKAAADGQMGCLVKVYREWHLSGDTDWLRRLWPRVRKALEFSWLPGGWDADADGVMEGCQHNTMDVEYYGPNPQMQAWYLAALKAAARMAEALGDAEFAARCRDLFQRGSRWMDEHLFNGEYYEQEVRPPASPDAVLPATRLNMGAADPARPDFQLGRGCLVDQLVGQYLAHAAGLGHLLEPSRVRSALRSILRYNRRAALYDHVNHMRTYALNDESALLMASYPRGCRPESPFPYFSEAMTGFEYCAAVHMIYEGLRKEGLRAIAAVRARYDGLRRNPFDEAECGHHYARAMAAWTAVPALTGFQYDGVAGAMSLAAQEGNWFWAAGQSWGLCRIRRVRGVWQAALQVLHGALVLRRFALEPGAGEVLWKRPLRLQAGTAKRITLRQGRTTP